MKNILLLIIFSILSFALQAKLIETKTMDFKVSPEKLLSNTIFSIKFYRPKSNLGGNLNLFDVENLRDQSNSELVFLKSAFLINKPISEMTNNLFLNPKKVAQAFQAKYKNEITETKWSMKMSVSVKTLHFNLETFSIQFKYQIRTCLAIDID